MDNYIDASIPVNTLEAEIVEEQPALPSSEESNTEETVIEGDIADGEAEPIQLSASFAHNVGTKYNYNIKDKVKSDRAPPSAIKIEKLPKHGKIMVTDHDGTIKEL